MSEAEEENPRWPGIEKQAGIYILELAGGVAPEHPKKKAIKVGKTVCFDVRHSNYIAEFTGKTTAKSLENCRLIPVVVVPDETFLNEAERVALLAARGRYKLLPRTREWFVNAPIPALKQAIQRACMTALGDCAVPVTPQNSALTWRNGKPTHERPNSQRRNR